MRQGFTLIQVSILLILASLVLVNLLPSMRANLRSNFDSTTKLNAVLFALRGYEAAHASLPCPADASQPIGSTSYGTAAANPGTSTNCSGGAPAANYVDAANNIAIGMVPVRTLGLSNDYALDGYGRDITYAVDTNATVCFAGALPGKITVTDNGTASSTVTALVSHGADGHGAWIPLTGSSGSAVRLNAGSTDADQFTNAHVNGSFSPTTILTNFIKKLPTATFDDLLVYKSSLWNINAAPQSTAALLPNVTSPANGSYYTGQTLTFTVTYASAVAVAGTPELQISIPQNSGSSPGTAASAITRYATYTGSSGNTATFTYTVQSSDYAPSSPSAVSISSPILLNGGTITTGGAAACLTFTPPNLSAVLLNPVSIYVVDHDNYRVQELDISGNYISQFGTHGSGNGQFNDLVYLAVDSSGNVYVVDDSNNRVEKFNSASTYVSQLGSVGGGNGQFVGPAGIGIDGGGNIWWYRR